MYLYTLNRHFSLYNLRCLRTQRHASGCLQAYPDVRTSHPDAYFQHPDTHRIPVECGIRIPIHSIRMPEHPIRMPLCSIRIPPAYLLNIVSEWLIIVSEFPMPHSDASMQHPDTPLQKAIFLANSYKIPTIFIYIYQYMHKYLYACLIQVISTRACSTM